MLLNNKRKSIDKIDKKILKLFNKRLEVIQIIKTYKQNNNIPVYDQTREQEVVSKAKSIYGENKNWPYLQLFLEEMMTISKKYQND